MISLYSGMLDINYPVVVAYSTQEVSGEFLNKQITIKTKWSGPEVDGSYPSFTENKITLMPNKGYLETGGMGNFYNGDRTIEIKVIYENNVIWSKSNIEFNPDDYPSHPAEQKYFVVDVNLTL